MTVDHYARSGRRWAGGPTRVYAPIARQLIGLSPHTLSGRTVLDAGAGTGAASDVLVGLGARVIATDLSRDMLTWNAATRPPAVLADVRALPFGSRSVDDVVAAFVLNHLVDPEAGLAELARVARDGGAVLVCVFSNASRSAVRDRVDALAQEAGWECPDWYLEMKTWATPVLGTAESMASALRAAGLTDVVSEERAVDVGVTVAEHLVAYRFGQAQFAAWLDGLGPERAAEVERRIAAEVAPIMEPYRPAVVFGGGVVP